MKKIWFLTILLIGSLLLTTLSLNFANAYADFKKNRNCNNNTDSERKEYCENELSFAKFTEIKWTREMSTTCCSFVSHDPFTNFQNHRISKLWWRETIIEKEWDSNRIYNDLRKERDSFWWINEKYHKIFLKLSSEVYSKASDKDAILKVLSLLFRICEDNSKDEVVRSVCEYFSYDLIWRSPKLSKIKLEDLLNTLKENKVLIKRTWQFSDFDENYTPINYHYSAIRSMYMIWDYALWIMDWYNFFKQDSVIDWMRIMLLKAWDTHRQDFAEINLEKYPLDYPLWDIELTFDWKDLYLHFQREYWSEDNIYYQWLLEWMYKFNEDWTRRLYQCNMITGPRYGEDSEKKKEIQPLSRCEQDLWITVTTIL